MTGIATLRTIVLDCPEPRELADFYTRLLGGRIVYNDDDWTTVEADGGVHVSFQRVPDHRPPTWPEGSRPQQIHLDVTVEDLDAAEQAVLELGAVKHEHQPGGDGGGFRVFLDPAGHPFCLCVD